MKKNVKTLLTIQQLELFIHLGVSAQEQKEKQKIIITIEIFFNDMPKACKTDQLSDTICYAILIDALKKFVAKQSFHLIEHVTYQIYIFIKTIIPPQYSLTINVTKFPHIEQLNGGITFSYSN